MKLKRFCLIFCCATLSIFNIQLISSNEIINTAFDDPSMVIDFRQSSEIDFNEIPPSGFIKDPEGNRMYLYAARRLDRNGDILCGEYIPKPRHFIWSHLGKVEKVSSEAHGIEILDYPRGTVAWVPEDHPLKPEFAPVVCGRHSQVGKKRYFCRALVESCGCLVVGYIEDGSNSCSVPAEGALHQMKEYEVLIVSELGKLLYSYLDDSDDHLHKENMSPCWVPTERMKSHGAKALGFEWVADNVEEFYSARIHLDEGSFVLGKYNLNSRTPRALYYDDGDFTASDKFALLDYAQGTLSWVLNTQNLRNNKRSQIVGRYRGKELFICRALIEEDVVLGHYDFNKQTCNVAYSGEAVAASRCEILVINDYGKALGVTPIMTDCPKDRPLTSSWGQNVHKEVIVGETNGVIGNLSLSEAIFLRISTALDKKWKKERKWGLKHKKVSTKIGNVFNRRKHRRFNTTINVAGKFKI